MTLSAQMRELDTASEQLSFLSEHMSEHAPSVARDVSKIASLVRVLEEDLNKANSEYLRLEADFDDEKSANASMFNAIFANTSALFSQRDEISKERDFYRNELDRVKGFFGEETPPKVIEEQNGLDFLPCKSVALDASGRSLHKVTTKNWRRSDGMILRSSQCLGTGPVKVLHIPEVKSSE